MKSKVVKKNGKKERYRKGKIIKSLKEAGLESHVAKNIANSLDIENGMTTDEIRDIVIEHLEHVDKKVYDKYVTTQRMKVHNDILEVEGNCLLDAVTMEEMGYQTGDEIDVINGEFYEKLRVFPISGEWIKPDHLYLSHEDMRDINVHNESRISFRKHEDN